MAIKLSGVWSTSYLVQCPARSGQTCRGILGHQKNIFTEEETRVGMLSHFGKYKIAAHLSLSFFLCNCNKKERKNALNTLARKRKKTLVKRYSLTV